MAYALIMNNTFDSLGDSFSSNKFPGKLWKIVNDCKTGAIGWGKEGRSIIVHKAQFQREYLDPPSKYFKTTHIGSFIRQLNLYGFKKVQPPTRHFFSEMTDPDAQEFQNDLFVQGNQDSVGELKRHVGVRKSRDQAIKRKMAPIEQHVETITPKFIKTEHSFGRQVFFPKTCFKSFSGSCSYVPLVAVR